MGKIYGDADLTKVTHTETEEELVMYVVNDGTIWATPKRLTVEEQRLNGVELKPIYQLKFKRVYHHYKGGLYRLITTAVHIETKERLVVYEGEDGRVWARSRDMFYGEVEVRGEIVKRFKQV